MTSSLLAAFLQDYLLQDYPLQQIVLKYVCRDLLPILLFHDSQML